MKFLDVDDQNLQTIHKHYWNNHSSCSPNGTEEEMTNFLNVSTFLTSLKVHVKIFYDHPQKPDCRAWSFLGDAPGSCVGYIWYDAKRQHVYEVLGTNLEARATHETYAGPLFAFEAGGKNSAAAKFPKNSSTKIRKDSLMKDASETTASFAADESRAHLHVDAERCKARVWNGGIYGGAQCLNKPVPMTDFCKSHTGPGKLGHGRYDNPMDPVVEAKF